MAAVFKRMQVSSDTVRQLLDILTSKSYGCGGLQGRYDPRNVMRSNFLKTYSITKSMKTNQKVEKVRVRILKYHNIQPSNKSYENVAKLKYLETLFMKNQNYIHTEMDSRLNSGIPVTFDFGICCLSICHLKTSRLKHTKLQLHSEFLYGCDSPHYHLVM